MAASLNVLSVAGGLRMETCSFHSNKIEKLGSLRSKLPMHQKSKRLNQMQKLSVRSVRADGGSKRGGDFLSGFFLGGVVFGTLAYVFGPQLRRYILNEDEYGFRRPRRLVYYEDESGLEKARQTLNWKIRQLNFAIDRVSWRLRVKRKCLTLNPLKLILGLEPLCKIA
ncbi:hypothetical protein HPP92_002272 [Vanilla planifolia]|uniref:Uncharacterized protein n=1 Tax=Vanilla planifolia TaxID=51239 RepID=A0A835S889_VANPL|nr:hypothetical protein HPP92_002272 [Vanilla planifolia]